MCSPGSNLKSNHYVHVVTSLVVFIMVAIAVPVTSDDDSCTIKRGCMSNRSTDTPSTTSDTEDEHELDEQCNSFESSNIFQYQLRLIE